VFVEETMVVRFFKDTTKT